MVSGDGCGGVATSSVALGLRGLSAEARLVAGLRGFLSDLIVAGVSRVWDEPLPCWRCDHFFNRGFGKGADCPIDDSVKQLIVVGLGLGLDHEAHAAACGGGIW